MGFNEKIASQKEEIYKSNQLYPLGLKSKGYQNLDSSITEGTKTFGKPTDYRNRNDIIINF